MIFSSIISSFLNIDKRTPSIAKLIKLEKNYRSVATILEAANKVIENNFERVDKKLYSTKGQGSKIQCYEAQDQADDFCVDNACNTPCAFSSVLCLCKL